ncbi:MAG: TonB-dependent receptor [Candidatus Marinimicrobia bacterium]|nr:TonB-dependent receptor [Candidatus Neomarinimicrobiota bacterium]
MNSLSTRTHSDNSPTLRPGFFYALWILFISLSSIFASNMNATTNCFIHGYTLDQNGHAIPYVSLVFKHSELFLLSDETGEYSYSAPIYANDSILIQRIGYEQKILSANELLLLNEIRLVPTVLTLEAVEVVAGMLTPASRDIAVLSTYSKTRGTGTVDHNKMLNRIPGIAIKTYGGPAGISTLSMDGGPSSHTRVLVNGIDITSAQNGEADISQLPLPFVESMQFSPYDIAESGSVGSDGIVKLEAGAQQNHVSISAGSFGHLAYDVNLNKQIFNFQTSLQIGQRHEKGNYPVVWSDTQNYRQNNDLEQRFAALRIRGLLRPDLFWQLTAMGSWQSRGVAGLVWSPDTISHREDQLQLLGSTLGWIRPSGNTRFNFTLRRSQEVYTNPYLNLESDHHLQSFRLEITDEQPYGKHLAVASSVSFVWDVIESSTTNDHSRISYGASLAPTIQFFTRLKLVPSLKYQYSPDLYERFISDLQLRIPLHWGPMSLIAASIGERYRYPSFNDQFWEPGGNPDLQPEETEVVTGQIHLDLQVVGNLIIQWQKKESTNLIQWMPVHSYWQPGNVLSATRESSKAMWRFQHQRWQLSAFAHLSLIHTTDHSRQKPLRYAPHQTSAFGLTWSPDAFEFNLQHNYVSERISMYDYPEDTILEASELWSLSVARTWFEDIGDITLVIAGDNLGNVRYESIRGYPEPGRSFRLSATYRFK